MLDVMEKEHLQAHATEVGNFLMKLLKEQKIKHPIIGDVRYQCLIYIFCWLFGSNTSVQLKSVLSKNQSALYLTNLSLLKSLIYFATLGYQCFIDLLFAKEIHFPV